MRHLLNTTEFSRDEVLQMIDLGRQMKKEPEKFNRRLAGKSVVTLFEKQSLRTRVTFDIGVTRLGGHAVYMDQRNGIMGQRESVRTMHVICPAGATVLLPAYMITTLCYSSASTALYQL